MPSDTGRRRAGRVIVAAFQTASRANGGLESLLQIVRGLHRSTVTVTQCEGPLVDALREAGKDVVVWPMPALRAATSRLDRAGLLARRAITLPSFNAKAASLVRQHDAPVVLCNDISSLWHLAPGAKAAGARIAFTIRDMFPPEAAYGPKWRLAMSLADVVIVLSESMREETLRRIPPMHGEPPRVETIYSIVAGATSVPAPAADRSAARQRLGLANHVPVVSYVAGVCAKKNQLAFIERAAPALLRRHPGTQVAFVGDFHPDADAYAARCAEAARAVDPSGAHLRFVGYTPNVRDYYLAADVTLLASRYEGLARCMIESMAVGTPVVSFDVTSAREMLEGYGAGLVSSLDDFPGIVENVARLLDDSPLARGMGTRGAHVAARLFRREEAVARYEAVLDGLAEESRG